MSVANVELLQDIWTALNEEMRCRKTECEAHDHHLNDSVRSGCSEIDDHAELL